MRGAVDGGHAGRREPDQEAGYQTSILFCFWVFFLEPKACRAPCFFPFVLVGRGVLSGVVDFFFLLFNSLNIQRDMEKVK